MGTRTDGSASNDTAARARLRRLATLCYGLLTLAAVLWIDWQADRSLTSYLYRGDLPGSVILGIATAVATVMLTRLLLSRVALARQLAIEMRTQIGSIDTPTAAHLAVVSAVGEELFFRGAMQPVAGYVATSLLFGLIHVGPDRRYLLWTASAVVLGFALGGIFKATGNLVGVVVSHATINVVNLRRIGGMPPVEAAHPPDGP